LQGISKKLWTMNSMVALSFQEAVVASCRNAIGIQSVNITNVTAVVMPTTSAVKALSDSDGGTDLDPQGRPTMRDQLSGPNTPPPDWSSSLLPLKSAVSVEYMINQPLTMQKAPNLNAYVGILINVTDTLIASIGNGKFDTYFMFFARKNGVFGVTGVLSDTQNFTVVVITPSPTPTPTVVPSPSPSMSAHSGASAHERAMRSASVTAAVIVCVVVAVSAAAAAYFWWRRAGTPSNASVHTQDLDNQAHIFADIYPDTTDNLCPRPQTTELNIYTPRSANEVFVDLDTSRQTDGNQVAESALNTADLAKGAEMFGTDDEQYPDTYDADDPSHMEINIRSARSSSVDYGSSLITQTATDGEPVRAADGEHM
jgi:hypothetical protein